MDSQLPKRPTPNFGLGVNYQLERLVRDLLTTLERASIPLESGPLDDKELATLESTINTVAKILSTLRMHLQDRTPSRASSTISSKLIGAKYQIESVLRELLAACSQRGPRCSGFYPAKT